MLPKFWWKLTAALGGLSGFCAVLELASRSYKEAIIWTLITMLQFELALYQKDESERK